LIEIAFLDNPTNWIRLLSVGRGDCCDVVYDHLGQSRMARLRISAMNAYGTSDYAETDNEGIPVKYIFKLDVLSQDDEKAIHSLGLFVFYGEEGLPDPIRWKLLKSPFNIFEVEQCDNSYDLKAYSQEETYEVFISARTSKGYGPEKQLMFAIGSPPGNAMEGAKARDIGEGVKLYYKVEDTKRNEVGIAVAESLKDSVAAVQRINDRIMSLRLDTKEGYWTIMSVYARPDAQSTTRMILPLARGSDKVRTRRRLPLHSRGMNGHVGSGRRGVERVYGGNGIGLINPDGERILDLAIAYDLAVCGTFFAKKESQKVTYASGGRRTEDNHILVRRPALKTVRDVKVIPGEDVASQHRPLVADLSIPQLTKPKETLGETKGGTRGDKSAWFWNKEVQAAVKTKKEAYKLWKLKRLAKTAVAKAKDAEMDALYKELDGPEGEKFTIRLAKARHRVSLDIRVVKAVKSADGRVLRKPVEVREGWEDYFKELLNELSVHPAVALHPPLVHEDEATPGFVSLDFDSPSAARPGLVSPLLVYTPLQYPSAFP
uniref:Cadherin domain-containing protein n=1 Tax=Heligmosomoides polygyrus TaxID=6339 RepID=A0A8L8JVB6_HELPZ